MMSRIDRVQEEIRHQVSLIIQRELNDPRIGFVTITRVKVSPELKESRVYFTTIEQDESFDNTVNGLSRAAGFIRKLLGERIRMKFTPHLSFVYDDQRVRNDRIDEIIEKIDKKKLIMVDVVKKVIANSTIVSPQCRIDVVEDPDDNKILECAVSANADYIISGDEQNLYFHYLMIQLNHLL